MAGRARTGRSRGLLVLMAVVIRMANCVQDPHIAKMNNLTSISILLSHVPQSAREWVGKFSHWPVYEKAFDLGHLPENKEHLSKALRVMQEMAKDRKRRNSLVDFGFVHRLIPLLSKSMLNKEDTRNLLLSLVLLAQHTKEEYPSANQTKIANLQVVLENNREVQPVSMSDLLLSLQMDTLAQIQPGKQSLT
eukprot:767257-Hanusia_phi.AAC.4